jgi:hypothetical protein
LKVEPSAERGILAPAFRHEAFIVNQVLCGCAAYRTQLFLYLKACGRRSSWRRRSSPATDNRDAETVDAPRFEARRRAPDGDAPMQEFPQR